MSFAMMAAIFGYAEPLRILAPASCKPRSKTHFDAELKNAIASVPWLATWYDVGENYLRGPNGTEFIFAGLRHNIGSIKSLAQIDIRIVEEAEERAGIQLDSARAHPYAHHCPRYGRYGTRALRVARSTPALSNSARPTPLSLN